MIEDNLVKEFSELFVGNSRSYGQFDPKTARMWAEKEEYNAVHVKKHLQGLCGLGLVPILDDGTCAWGAIDVDAHGEGESIDLVGLEAKVRKHKLPLVVCRSKSGGAHCYLFLREPIEARVVVAVLNTWANILGHGGSEIFPKQIMLKPNAEGIRPLGNWINLPYFNIEDTDRWALEGKKRLNFDYFLELAKSKRVGLEEIQSRGQMEHPEAPPCFQAMYSMGVSGTGHRNNALYNAVIYLKKVYPEDYRDHAREFNLRAFAKPLKAGEADKTIASAGRRDYSYKCMEEPIRSLCDKQTCLKRKFGITPADDIATLPKFSDLRKYKTDPVFWEISIDGIPIIVSTKQLMKYALFREQVFEVTNQPPPRIKEGQWDIILGELTANVEEVEVPEDASTFGILREKLDEFLSRADVSDPAEDRGRLQRGMPISTTISQVGGDDRHVIAFRMQDFVAYLKKVRFEEYKGSRLYVILKNFGIEPAKLKVHDSVVSCWVLPADKLKSPKVIRPRLVASEY